MVAQTRAGAQPSPKKLNFHEKLVGKGLSTDALLKKLKVLHRELAEMDQELVDVNSLGTARKELINTSILLHKDRGVKAFAACCLADILKLYAPDAPYTQSELRDIFQFFFRQLTNGLKGADSSYYDEYFHLLESLSTVKSVVLVCDLPTAEELLVEIFRDLFNIIRRDLAKNIEMFIADILIALIDESQVLPSEVLDTVMTQFMDKNARMDQPAFRLAVQVCNSTADKLQRHVCQYFTDIIVTHSPDEEFDEIRTAHDLIKQLNKSCPSLLHSVIPQLEEELRVEDVQLRTIATQTLGEMFSDKGGSDLVKKYPTAWNVWLLRKNDKVAAIRLKFVESAKGLLINLPDHREIIEEALHAKLMDPDEKVRAAVCKLYSQLDYETSLHHVSEAQLRAVAGRGLDKKHVVRVEALTSIGKLYSLAYPEIESGDPAAIQQFSWIPNEILSMVAVASEVRSIAEQIIADNILPLPSPSSSSSSSSSSKSHDIDETAWTDRLLNTMKYLDDKAIKSLFGLTAIKQIRPSMYDYYVQACVQNNGGIIDENEETVTKRLGMIIQRIAVMFQDPQKAAEDLHSFARINEGRLYKLMKTCLELQTDLKGLVKATNEFVRRTEQASSSIVATLSTVLRRGSLRFINQSSIPTLIKRVQKGDGNEDSQAEHLARNAQSLLAYVSKHCPALYQSHIGELTKSIADDKNPRLVEVCLQALAAVVKWDPKLAPSDKRTVERTMRFALESNPRHAKFAGRVLTFFQNRDELCTKVVDTITDQLPEAEPELLVAHISVLAQFALLATDAFEEKSDDIMTFLVKKVIQAPSERDPDDMDSEGEWIEDARMPPSLSAKTLALKVLRNLCIAHASSENAVEIAQPVVRMLNTLLEHSGSLSADADDDPKVKTRLRLQAAISLLHLSTLDVYVDMIATNFLLLAISVQDSCYQVRIAFLTKLVFFLTLRKLHPRFNVIPFLTVHDPEADVKSTTVAFVSFASRNMPTSLKLTHFDMIFIRLLHLLAHHPDFAITPEALPDIAKYVEFYLSLVASSENISLLYHLAMKAKTVRDAESQKYSENLYVMSELAQELIKNFAHLHSWSVESYPGKVKLPSDILRALPNAEVASKILKTVYLPEETSVWLTENSRASKNTSNLREKRKAERAEPRSSAKRKAPVKSNGYAKRSRTAANRWNSDESDEDDESSLSETSDVDEAEVDKNNATSNSDDDVPETTEREEKLGRGARTRAKAKIRKQVKSSKSKGKGHSSDG